jgi:hypothetical protein
MPAIVSESILVRKCQARLEVSESNKHSILLLYAINYGRKKIIIQAFKGRLSLAFKCKGIHPCLGWK